MKSWARSMKDGSVCHGTPMKPPIKRLSDLKGPPAPAETFAPPSPKVARRKPGKVLTAAEKAAFLASRPDLKS